MTEPLPKELPLFPLHAVVFPGGLLRLKVFEARYLDLIGRCLREQRGFGAIALKQGSEVRRAGEAVAMETVGVLAEVIDVDGTQPNILQVQCRGSTRFEIRKSRQEADGLWVAEVAALPDDAPVPPAANMVDTARGLANAITTLKQQGSDPFLKPFQFEQAGWVANRWCEILPISQAAKQKLMELPDPLARLQLVDDFLRSKGVVGGSA